MKAWLPLWSWVLLATAACGGGAQPASYTWELPVGFPEPWVPEDNPMTAEKVSLGHHLFYDKRLSGNGTLSCSSCHEQSKAFSDGKMTPTGSTGDAVPRNAPGLANVAYFATYAWANPLLDTLEKHALVPMYGEHPVELGLTGHEDTVLARFSEDAQYQSLFKEAFPDEAQPVQRDNVVKALASFQRTIISGNSAYDRYNQGDSAALSDSAKRGLDLFLSERAECYHCHGGLTLTTSFRSLKSTTLDKSFQNTGLYNLDSTGRYPEPNGGLFEFTQQVTDMGKFRPPSLRNVARTGPYMHDGTIATLPEVIEFYASGGRNITTGPNTGDGRSNPNKSSFIRPFFLTTQEKADLVAFLESLTDESFLSDPRFANPF